MANKKFSEFVLKTSTSDVSHIVGYNGAENVQITPANFVTGGGTGIFLPLAGGTMTGALVVDSTATVNDILTAGLGLAITGGAVGTAKLVQLANNFVYLYGGSSGLVLGNGDGTTNLKVAADFSWELAGVEKMKLDASGNLGIGVAASEKLSVMGTDNTNQARIGHTAQGVFIKVNGTNVDYNSSGNTIGSHTFSTGNAERMRITADGKLSLGTSFPSSDSILTLSTASSTGLSLKSVSNAGESFINFGDSADINAGRIYYGHSDNAMRFRTNDALAMLIDSAGNVGIGSTNPSAYGKFLVEGTGLLINANATSGAASFGLYEQGAGRFGITTLDGTPGAKFTLAGTERMRLDSIGNLGLGTTTINRSGLGADHTVMTIGTNSGMGMLELQGNRTSNADLGRIAWLNAGTRLAEIVSSRIDNDTSTQMLFRTSDTGSLSTKMTLSKAGNLGVGTAPTAKLTLFNDEADISINVNTGTGGSYPKKTGISFGATSTSLGGDAEFTGGAGIQAINIAAFGNKTDLAFWTTFSGSPTERMRIDSSGNLLVGATATSEVSNLTVNHLLEGNSSTVGSGGVGVYNNTGTANVPSLVVLQRDTSTDSTCRFIQFYSNVTDAGNTAMGGIVGNGASNAQFATLSDIREKENIKSISGSLDKINSLNPVEFDWKKTGEHIKAGFVAQEVEEIFPEYVIDNFSNQGEEERKGLTGGMTSGIVAHLVLAIKELKAEIELLKK